MLRMMRYLLFVAGCGSLLACGGGAPAPAASLPARAAPPAAAVPAAEPYATASAGDPPPPSETSSNGFVDHLGEAHAAAQLGADFAKLLTLAKLSPKTHKSLLKNYLYEPLAECTGQPLVEVKASPGLLVADGKVLKARQKTYESLKAAGALAKQRGRAIELVSAHQSINDAVMSWNRAMIENALLLVTSAPRGVQKEKSFAQEARKQFDVGDGPKSWSASPCESGHLGGYAVDVQLVTLDASGARSAVLVKAGTDGDRFIKETFEATYWDKPKGKDFRMLTEVMSAGGFVRQCSEAFHFTAAPKQDGTWRCKEGTESWDPPNRPLPAWQ